MCEYIAVWRDCRSRFGVARAVRQQYQCRLKHTLLCGDGQERIVWAPPEMHIENLKRPTIIVYGTKYCERYTGDPFATNNRPRPTSRTYMRRSAATIHLQLTAPATLLSLNTINTNTRYPNGQASRGRVLNSWTLNILRRRGDVALAYLTSEWKPPKTGLRVQCIST